MSDKEFMEERYIGSRLFRKLYNGEVVEVLGDGKESEFYDIGGRSMDSNTTFDEIQSSQMERYMSVDENPQAPPEQPPEPTSNKTSDSRVSQFKTNYAGVPTKKTVKDIMAEFDKVNPMRKNSGLGGGHGMGEGHGMGGGTQMDTGTANPWDKNNKPGFFNKKPSSYKEHMDKVMGRFGGDSDSNPFASNQQRRFGKTKKERSGGTMGSRK